MQPPARAFAPLIVAAALFATGCRTFPVSLIVAREALDEMGETSYEEHLRKRDVSRAVRDALGSNAPPISVTREEFYRTDRGAGPFSAKELGRAPDAWTGLCSGDLVLAKNVKPQSLGTTLGIREFTYFDHMGVLVQEEGRWFVYESWPAIRFFGSAPSFAERWHGRAGRTRIEEFARRYELLELVRLPDPARNAALVRGARESLEEGIVFDPYHDPERPGFDCSEYVQYLIVEKAGYPYEFDFVTVGDNPSAEKMRLSLGFTTEAYLVPDTFALLPGVTRVGAIARHATESELMGLRAAQALLHERFDASARIGDYLAPQPLRMMRYRKNVLAYFEWTKGWFRAHPTTEAEAIRRVVERLYPIFFVSKE